MKAIIYRQYGAAEVLQLADRPTPSPLANEVLIRVHAAEATKSDCELRSFHFPVQWFWLPLRLALGIRKPKRQILGGYFAGQITQVGAAVQNFAPGERVFGSSQLRFGAYGEYLCLPSDYTLATIPDGLSYAEAAAVPLGGLNALHFMDRAGIQAGEHVLINGAGGSIGTYAVQIAKQRGAQVTAVDSGTKAALLRGLGADRVIDYRQTDFRQSPASYDVILDMVASSPYGRTMRALRPKGRYLMANPTLLKMLQSVVTSIFSSQRALFAFAGETRAELHCLQQMLSTGELKAVVDRVYPMSEAVDAHRRVESEQRLGSVVIQIGTAES
ncbi:MULTISPECIES: NAD(P)-dependent alcohol dehydrogenase [Reinekea]|uniref:Alcohol dehydrogenase n=1 Tax=Reinekea forsetii TaxID=1336806 RepID=A0A2K8KT47_9GAMM|nr:MULTISPECIES: NAD(P)-dependent alcohol dehydrogenase [Reinekea]ATX77905.1 alcohol dehydrogenase [Reinekea forsetii]MDO7643895.1 NAD(P)-dependent alcohol dehydrogenase [Reinekea forsetii]